MLHSVTPPCCHQHLPCQLPAFSAAWEPWGGEMWVGEKVLG